MVDTRPWWPPGYDRPAFQVRRQIFGTVTGGDYVRGSGVLTLAHTALRYPRAASATSAVSGSGVLHARPVDHSTVEIQWGWPLSPHDEWLEVSLVRSAFGRPSTVNDGQTVFRAEYEAFLDPATGKFPIDRITKAVLPPPLVLDNDLPAGRWYHYGLFFKVTPVQWVRGMVDSCLLPRDLHHADHLWDNVPPYYQWVDGNLANRGYLKPFLSIFGFELDQCREFIESWQHLYDADWSPIRLLKHLGANFGVPYESGIGDIRYRSLMADIGHLYEVRGTEASLTDLVANMSKYAVTVTGGASLMLTPDDSDFYLGIGNWAGLHPESSIASMPYPSSTTFPSLGLYPAPALLTPDHVKLAKTAPDEVLPPKGRGAMRVWSSFADATTGLMVTVGDGLQYPDYNAIDLSKGVEKLPKSYGIPVEPLSIYGFAVSVKTALAPVTVQAVLLWFDQAGEPYQMLSSVLSAPLGVADTNWHDVFIEGAAPANAVFMVPGVLFTSRVAGAGPTNSPYLYIAGAMAYFVGGSSATLVIPPDRYLTMGDPGELIGPADPSGHPTFQPFVLGSPSN